MEDNLYSEHEIALMRSYNEKETIIDIEYHNMLYVHNPDQKNVAILGKKGRKTDKISKRRKKKK